MSGSLRRIALVTRKLLRQNWLLILLLLLWPFVLTAILLFSAGGHPAAEDVSSILQQELFYGLALVTLSASTALGTEQRAHRVQQVLGRAVGRGEYLLALGASAYLPFTGYVLVWLLNAAGLNSGLTSGLHLHSLQTGSQLVAELAAGLLLCGLGLLWSVMLPQMVAAGATSICLALLLTAGTHGVGGLAALFGIVTGTAQAHPTALWLSTGIAALVSALLVLGAARLFTRRDLRVV